MAINRELVLIDMRDIGAVAEAHALIRLVKDIVAAAAPVRCQVLALLERESVAVSALLAEGLRAHDGHDEIRRLRDATVVLADVRTLAYQAMLDGLVSVPLFDEVMAGTARCRREIASLESSARHRARRTLDQQ
jgi:hypothetical protein